MTSESDKEVLQQCGGDGALASGAKGTEGDHAVAPDVSANVRDSCKNADKGCPGRITCPKGVYCAECGDRIYRTGHSWPEDSGAGCADINMPGTTRAEVEAALRAEVRRLRNQIADQALTIGTLKDELGRLREENARLSDAVSAPFYSTEAVDALLNELPDELVMSTKRWAAILEAAEAVRASREPKA